MLYYIRYISYLCGSTEKEKGKMRAPAATIIEDLSLNRKGQYTITLRDFSQIEDALCESGSRFTYNASDGTFRFIKPTWIHACSSTWLKAWVYEMEHFVMIHPHSLGVVSNADLQGFEGRFDGRWVTYS